MKQQQPTNSNKSCASVSLGSSNVSLAANQSNICEHDVVENDETTTKQTSDSPLMDDDTIRLHNENHCFDLVYDETERHHQLNRSPCSSTSWRADSMCSGNSSSSTVQQQSSQEEEYNNDDGEGSSSSDYGRTISNNTSSDTSQLETNNNNGIAVRLKRYMSISNRKNRHINSNSSSVKSNKMINNQAARTRSKKLPIDDSIEQLLNANKRQIQITTCAQIYNRWRSTKRLYHKAPKNGIQLKVDYIDTGITMASHLSDRAPIVLALHGAPGSYTDYGLLIQHLTGQTIRVIAPNFPEYTATVETKTLFRHSADEKASYLRDFLRAIDVNRIDLLVSHSSAVFPSLLILLNDNPQYEYKQMNNINNNNDNGKEQTNEAEPTSDYHIQIRALALFNPAGHRLPQSMKPTWFKCGSVRIYQNKLGRAFFQKFGTEFLTIVGVPVRVNNMDHVMLSATVMRNSECQRVVHQLNYLSQLKLPTLLVFSENDKLIEKDIFYEMTQFMGLNRNHFDIFNHQGKVEQAHSQRDNWIRVMVFKAGGHYAYSNYANTVNKAVTELLCKVCSCSDSKALYQANEQQKDMTDATDGDEKRNLKLLLDESQQRQQQLGERQKVTIITDRFSPNVQVKRHFKW